MTEVLSNMEMEQIRKDKTHLGRINNKVILQIKEILYSHLQIIKQDLF